MPKKKEWMPKKKNWVPKKINAHLSTSREHVKELDAEEARQFRSPVDEVQPFQQFQGVANAGEEVPNHAVPVHSNIYYHSQNTKFTLLINSNNFTRKWAQIS